jgi:hypothetical protein
MGFTLSYNPGAYISPLVPLVMFGWFPLVFYFFHRFPAQKAVVVSFVLAWSFLPEAEMILPGIPDYDKMSATCYGVLFATCLFDFQRIRTYKYHPVDLPLLIYCICPLASSLSNGLGLYDGVTASIDQSVTFGLPYFLGRIYLNNLEGARKLALGIFFGGLVYAPLCLFESRMSPQLHRLIYGANAIQDWRQNIRLGGFRPMVFMRHGLAVSGWMVAAALICLCLWKSGVLKRVKGVPMLLVVPLMFITIVFLKSTGAYILTVFGVGILVTAWYLRTALPALILVGMMSFYLFQNALTETYITDQIAASLTGIVPQERIDSMVFRFNNEEILADKARQRVVFGWGGWGRNRVFDEQGNDITVTDSLWIIVFGINGLVGLFSLFGSFFIPTIAFIKRYPGRLWSHPKVAPAAGLLVAMLMYALDCILNAMANPIYSLIAGSIAGVAVYRQPQVRQRVLQPEAIAPGEAPQAVAMHLNLKS